MKNYFTYLFYKNLYSSRQAIEKFWFSLAWKLPKKLVYYCGVRMGAHATTGQYGSDNVDEVTMIETLKRWARTSHEKEVQGEEEVVRTMQTIQDGMGHSMEEQRASQIETR